jgi:hypothetical protein
VSQVVNPADRLAVIRVIIVALVVVLALIGLANLLTASALGLSVSQLDTVLNIVPTIEDGIVMMRKALQSK